MFSKPESVSGAETNLTSKTPRSAYDLIIDVLEARNLTAKDFNNSSDPYCVIKLNSTPHVLENPKKTAVKKKNLNPVWNESFAYRISQLDVTIAISVWDQDYLSADDFLGLVSLNMLQMHEMCAAKDEKFKNGDKLVEVEDWFPLTKTKNKKYAKEDVSGDIKLKISLKRVSSPKQLLHFTFLDNMTSRVQDFSGQNNHGRLRNIGDSITDDIIKSEDGKGAKFTGFNYVECERNPMSGAPEYSISLWFRCDDPSLDMVLLSTLTSNPRNESGDNNDSDEDDELEQSPGVKRKSGITSFKEKAQQLTGGSGAGVPTKSIFAGLSIGTVHNQIYDNSGMKVVVDEDQSYQDDLFFGKAGNRSSNSFSSSSTSISTATQAEEEPVGVETWNRADLFKPKVWNHLVFVYTGKRIREFINGALVEDKKTSGKPIGNTNGRMQLGAYVDDLTYIGFKGEITNVQIVNYPMSDYEVERAFASKP